MIALKIAQRELTAAWRERLHGFRILMLCLIFGIASISAIGSLRGAIDAGLNSNGRVFLGGDAEIELTYRQANAQEVTWMTGQSLAQSQIIDFRSMAVAPATNKRLLTQIKAVDSAYPLVGAVTLSDGFEFTGGLCRPGRPAGCNTRPRAPAASQDQLG